MPRVCRTRASLEHRWTLPDALRIDARSRCRRCPVLPRAMPRCKTVPRNRWPMPCRSLPERACWMPAPRPAARPRTCWNAILPCACWRWMWTSAASTGYGRLCADRWQAEYRRRRDRFAWWDGEPFDACCWTRLLGHRHRAPATGCAAAPPPRRPGFADRACSRVCWMVLEDAKPGGALLYATCSILKDENEHQIVAVPRAHRRCARRTMLDERYGHAAGPGRQRLPGEQGMDGFFYALLRKRDPNINR